jgi:hypothetical protein
MAGNLRVFDAFIVHPSVGYAQITTHELLLDFLFLYAVIVVHYPLSLEYTFPLLWCKDDISHLCFALSLLNETIKLRAPYPVLPDPNFDDLELVVAYPLSDSSNVYFHELGNLFGCKHLVT